MANREALEAHVVPGSRAAAAAAGRPEPRVVVGLPVAVHDDVDEARNDAARQYGFYGELPNYARILRMGGLERGGCLCGRRRGLGRSASGALVDAGATDVWAAIFPVGADRQGVATLADTCAAREAGARRLTSIGHTDAVLLADVVATSSGRRRPAPARPRSRRSPICSAGSRPTRSRPPSGSSPASPARAASASAGRRCSRLDGHAGDGADADDRRRRPRARPDPGDDGHRFGGRAPGASSATLFGRATAARPTSSGACSWASCARVRSPA